MTTIADVIQFLETIAPRSLQESYDNARLICGDRAKEVKGVVVSLDALESVVDEAIVMGANLVVSHHPIVFSGLKSLTGSNYIERTLLKAIKHDIALYAIHTNLDNVLQNGVNERIAEQLGLSDLSILSPKTDTTEYDLRVSDVLKDDVFSVFHGLLKNDMERFGVEIVINDKGILVSGPSHIERIVDRVSQQYQLSFTSNQIRSTRQNNIGAGLIGHTSLPLTELEFLQLLKEKLNLRVVRHTSLRGRSIQKVAVCGGSGSFLLSSAIGAGADIFVTGDYKYHQFFDADGRIVIADVGHYESEQFTVDLLVDQIKGKFSNFAARCAKTPTNPVNYYC